MARKKKVEQEQLDLIEVRPQNAKEILVAAKAYKKIQTVRISAGAKEEEEKQKILALVKEANLQPFPDGTIKFTLDGVSISVKPSKMKLTVKCDDEE